MARTARHREDESVQTHPQQNLCFCCGQDNPTGMGLKFVYDEEGKRFISRFRLGSRYTGPPGHAHGGIIATILDEVMGKVNRLRRVVAVTSEMTVKYLKPVPLGEPLIAAGYEVRVRGRVHFHAGEIRDSKGQLLACAQGKFIAIDPQKVFPNHWRGKQAGKK
jgi:uncharacterized protein (TIGR00369 family)